jgi:hypothetical protein
MTETNDMTSPSCKVIAQGQSCVGLQGFTYLSVEDACRVAKAWPGASAGVPSNQRVAEEL